MVYAHFDGCQAGGCNMWGRYQVSLENDLQITLEGSGDFSECPTNVCEENQEQHNDSCLTTYA